MVLDQLRQPGVIHVAAKIPGLDSRMPETRNQQHNRYQQERRRLLAQESPGGPQGELRGWSGQRLTGHSVEAPAVSYTSSDAAAVVLRGGISIWRELR